MQIGFYAPLKSPDDPIPSGDRTIAMLMVDALTQGGHSPRIMSALRALDISGDPLRQENIRRQAEEEIDRILKGFEAAQSEPIDLWFTYHLFHKAPDWIGPKVCARLGIPYVVAEASYAPRQKNGPWDMGLQQVGQALAGASGVISLNPRDIPCIQPFISENVAQLSLRPFAHDTPQRNLSKQYCKDKLAKECGLDADVPWLLSVAMMRPGDKQRSYEILAQSLELLPNQEWRLIVIGDGEVKTNIQQRFRSVSDRVFFAGSLEPEKVHAFLDASDLFVWPAINEAFGMAVLEAQRHGVAVVAGRTDGVATVVEQGVTGTLVNPGDAALFAEAVAGFLNAPARCQRFGASARKKFLALHNFHSASQQIDTFLRSLI